MPIGPPWTSCAPTDMTPVWWCRPALAICGLDSLSSSPLEPAVATAAGRHLARRYAGDWASTDWRHLGRLAGFTNQKPARRTPDRYAPWVRLVYARAGLAPCGASLLESVRQYIQPPAVPLPDWTTTDPGPTSAAEAAAIYQGCMQRWQIRKRFPQPDWSIVDLWVARHLLSQGRPAVQIQAILRLASPHFPRRHGDPDDYLRRTVARAAFPSPGELCARITIQPPRHAPATLVRTPPVADNPAPSAVASGYRPCR